MGQGGEFAPIVSEERHPPASARRDGQRGASGCAATQPLAKRKKTARRSHFVILHLLRYFTVDRRKCQWQSGFGSRSTADEMLCKTTSSGGETKGKERMLERVTQDSLIKRINSLMSRFNSRNKFPVPMRRELHGKPLNYLLELRADSCTQRPTRRKFPVFSQLAGNLASETSSLETAPPAKSPLRTCFEQQTTQPPRDRTSGSTGMAAMGGLPTFTNPVANG